jgi:hypothetical protein
MKRRHRRLLNLFALALLALAFYLTFIQKETPEFNAAQIANAGNFPAAFIVGK